MEGDVIVQVDDSERLTRRSRNEMALNEDGGEQSEKRSHVKQKQTPVEGSEKECQTEVHKEGKQQLFTPIPPCSWKKCARVRPKRRFIGHTVSGKMYKIPGWWREDWVTMMSHIAKFPMEVERRANPIDNEDPRWVYGELQTETIEPQPPPEGEYVVLGIFGTNERLLKEVVVYIGGRVRSKHLYRGTGHIFKLPILREIASFGLYKCDQQRRVHVRVDVSAEDRDSLNTLFETVKAWSDYYYLRDYLEFSTANLYFWVPTAVRRFIAEGTMAYYIWLGMVKSPEVKEEEAWCEWIQKNLNKGERDPSAGQYSIEVVVGWSRRRILAIVVMPFILFLCCTTIFALLWSNSIGAHEGDISAGFTIASYFAGLAGATVALIGFFGGSLAYK